MEQREMTAFETRITAVTVVPVGSPIYVEMATKIEIVDEAAGEFVEVKQCRGQPGDTGSVLIAPDEWPAVRKAIDKMIGECRSEEKTGCASNGTNEERTDK